MKTPTKKIITPIEKIMIEKRGKIKELTEETWAIKRQIVKGKFSTEPIDTGWSELEWKLHHLLGIQKTICKYELQLKKLKDCYFNA